MDFEQQAEQEETYETPFLCDNCGTTGNLFIKLNAEVIDSPCPNCGHCGVLMQNFEATRGYTTSGQTFVNSNGRVQFVFDPVALRKDITSCFKILTLEGTPYKLNRVKHTYDVCDVWLKQLIAKTLGDNYLDRRMKEVYEQIRVVTAVEEYPLPNPVHVPFSNGIYELDTRTFRDYTENDYFFNRLPIDYSLTNSCDKIDDFFKTVTSSERERNWLIEWASTVFIRRIDTAKMLLITGYGSNGKSVYGSLLCAAVGKNLNMSLSLHEMKDFGLEPLYINRPLLNVSGELSRKKDLEQDTLKKLISGEPITLNRKNKSFVTFSSTTKFLATTNDLPENLKDLSDGWCRRILPLHFENVFAENEQYKRDLCDLHEVGAWVSKVVVPTACAMLEGKLITDALAPDEVRSFFNENMNSISAFAEDRLELDSSSKIEITELQNAYAAFCVEQKLKRSSNIALGKGLKRFFKNKARLRWNDPSPVDVVTSRVVNGQDTFTECYKGVRFKE